MRTAFLIAAALALTACASPYKEHGIGGGVSAQPIDGKIMRIYARGNGYTSPARVTDFVLLKSAEETLRAGKAGFVILSGADRSRVHHYTTPGSAVTTGNVSAYGNHASYSSQTIYSPGQTLTFHKPAREVFIALLTAEELKATPDALDARAVWNNLAPRYIKRRRK